MPTLLDKGNLIPNNDIQRKEILDNYIPINYLLNIIKIKEQRRKDKIATIHDRILIIEALTGAGKSTLELYQLWKTFYYKDEIPEIDTNDFFAAINNENNKNENKSINVVKKQNSGIIVTQPKILLAISIPTQQLGNEFSPELVLGENMGYSTSIYKQKADIESHSLMFVTIGTLLQQLKLFPDEDIMAQYDFIIIDEAHERSIELDTTLFYLKKFLKRNYNNVACPLIIIQSATLNIAKYAEFMGTVKENAIKVAGTPTFKINDIFLDEPTNDLYLSIANTIKKIHIENADDSDNECDILVFLPGEGEMKIARDIILKELQTISAKIKGGSIKHKKQNINDNKQNSELLILELSSSVVNKSGKYANTNILDQIKDYTLEELRKEYKDSTIKRRVILATNVAESGVTINTLKYVIDSGIVRVAEYNPVMDCNIVYKKPAPQSSIKQRRGRVGRKFDGNYYAMYDKETYENCDLFTLPDIYSKNINRMLIDILNSTISNNQSFCFSSINDIKIPKMLDQFPTDSIYIGLNKIKLLYSDIQFTTISGLESSGNLLQIIAKMPRLSIESARMILSAYIWNCNLADVITMAVFADADKKDYLNIDKNKDKKIKKSLFGNYKTSNIIKELGGELGAFYAQALICDEFIESIWLVQLYKILLTNYNLVEVEEIMMKLGINFKNFLEIMQIRKEVMESLYLLGFRDSKMEETTNWFSPQINLANEIMKYKHCIYDGYKFNIAKLIENTDDIYKNYYGSEFKINAYFSTEKKPKHIIYNRLAIIQTNMGFIKSIDKVCVLDGYLS